LLEYLEAQWARLQSVIAAEGTSFLYIAAAGGASGDGDAQIKMKVFATEYGTFFANRNMNTAH
jgi:hypothetical protein